MRVLFVAPEIPWPTNSGGRQRTYALLKAIARRHEVIFTAPVDWRNPDAPHDHIASLVQDFLPVPVSDSHPRRFPREGSLATRWTRFAKDYASERKPYRFRLIKDDWKEKLQSAMASCDIAFCRYAYSHPPVAGFPLERTVIDADDLQYRGHWQRSRQGRLGLGTAYWALEAARSYRYERWLLRRAAWTLVCSDDDLARVNAPHASILRNGIDLPSDELASSTPAENTVVMVGSMGYEPNTLGLKWFLQAVWPLVRQQVPTAKLHVVGRDADEATLPFASGVAGVTLVGPVDEVGPWVASATCSVVPLHIGMGTRIKLIEALGFGRPVVATSIGADGLPMFDESHGLMRRDEPSDMAAAIATTLAQPAAALARAQAGRQLVQEQFSWDAITASLSDELTERFCSLAPRERAVSLPVY